MMLPIFLRSSVLLIYIFFRLYSKTEKCLKQALGDCGPEASKKLTDIIFEIIGNPSKSEERPTQSQHRITRPPGATLTTFKKTATKVSVCYHYFRSELSISFTLCIVCFFEVHCWGGGDFAPSDMLSHTVSFLF